MNYITPEQIKEYVSQNPEGIAGMSKELSEMVNHFAKLIVGEFIDGLRNTYGPDECLPQEEIALFLKKRFGVEE